MEALLSMKNIKKSFSGVAALKNAELELNKGEVVALMGEKEAGKSTLMNDLTVAQNLFIGQERMSGFFIDDKKMERDA